MTTNQPEAAAKQSPRNRSPMYPHVGLKGAIERVRTAHDKIGKASVGRSTLAVALGLTSDKSGTALTWLSTVRQYGLTESRGGGEYGVSDLGRSVLFEQGFSREEALRKAAMMPQAFQLIQQTFSEKAPDQDTLVNWLQLHDFTAKAAPVAAKAYRETSEYMASELVSGQGDQSSPAGETIAPEPTAGSEPSMDAVRQTDQASSGGTTISWPLRSGNRFSFSADSPLTETDFEDVKKILDALSVTAAADPERESVSPQTDSGAVSSNGTADTLPLGAVDQTEPS